MVLPLVFDAEVFTLADLQTLMNTNKAMMMFLSEECNGSWKKQFLNGKNKILPDPSFIISDRHWPGPYIPGEYDCIDLRIPLRPRARTKKRPGRYSCYPDRNDLATKGHVMATSIHSSILPRTRFNKETGVLEDLFHPAHEKRRNRTDVYIPRPLPIVCYDCGGITCTSYEELVDHCRSLEHQLATIPPDRRIPMKKYWDPRCNKNFTDKTPFHQVKALFTYRQIVLDFLRAPMDSAGIQNMEVELQYLKRNAIVNEFSAENLTIEQVTDVCVDVVVDSFLENGMKDSCECWDILLDGWGGFRRDTVTFERLFDEYISDSS